MRVLIVASFQHGCYASFINEQVNSLRAIGVEFDYFGVSGKGVLGYLSCLSALNNKIKEYKPNLIHAHYGLCGLLANLQRKIPVVTTFHGSDIHSLGLNLMLSKICMRLSAYNIFVSQLLQDIAKYEGDNYIVQACGLDIGTIKPIDFMQAREYFGWKKSDKYILFAGSFTCLIKNYMLAKGAIEKLDGVKLIELKGYTREEVSLLMNGCDCLLLTSFREASPTVVKEAMACNRPIVTTGVGDVRWVMGNTEGCYITSYDEIDCSKKIEQAIAFSKTKLTTNGRERIIELGLDCERVAQRLHKLYNSLLEN